MNPSRKTIPQRGDDPLAGILDTTEEERTAVARILEAAGRGAPPFWHPGVCEELHLPVQGAELRVYRHVPRRGAARRPIVLIPGWGAIPETFQDFFEVVHDRAEWYFLETREKASSRLASRRVDMSVAQSVRDVQEVLETLGLVARGDFVLIGACWGAAIILEGLITGTLTAPTAIAADPMHRMWFPQWALRWVAPWLPDFVARLIKPVLREAMLGEELQEAGFVPDFHAQLLRLVQLGASGFAGHHERGLLGHAARHLRAQRLQPCLGGRVGENQAAHAFAVQRTIGRHHRGAEFGRQARHRGPAGQGERAHARGELAGARAGARRGARLGRERSRLREPGAQQRQH